jgi:hypothetical protein
VQGYDGLKLLTYEFIISVSDWQLAANVGAAAAAACAVLSVGHCTLSVLSWLVDQLSYAVILWSWWSSRHSRLCMV